MWQQRHRGASTETAAWRQHWNRPSLVLSLLPRRGRSASRPMLSDVLDVAFTGDTPLLVLCLCFSSRARICEYGFAEAFIFKTALEVPDVILVRRPLLIFIRSSAWKDRLIRFVLRTCSVIVDDFLAVAYCALI